MPSTLQAGYRHYKKGIMEDELLPLFPLYDLPKLIRPTEETPWAFTGVTVTHTSTVTRLELPKIMEDFKGSVFFNREKDFRLLERLFNLSNNPGEVKRFLLVNSYLIEILLEAPTHIYRIFGQVPMELELHHDPEEGWEELFIVIKSAYSAEEAIRLENKLAEEWFLDRMKDTRGKLNITEEPL